MASHQQQTEDAATGRAGADRMKAGLPAVPATPAEDEQEEAGKAPKDSVVIDRMLRHLAELPSARARLRVMMFVIDKVQEEAANEPLLARASDIPTMVNRAAFLANR